MKNGTSVSVRTPRGTVKLGKLVKKDTTGTRGEYWVIKPHEKGAETFKARPSMCTAV